MASVPQTPTNPGSRLGNRQVNLQTGNKDGTKFDWHSLRAVGGRFLGLIACHTIFEALLLWRDPVKSGLVLAGITVAYILLEWSHLSLLRIVSHSLLAAVTLSFLWNNIASFTNRPGVPLPPFLRHGLSESQVRQFAETAVGPINRILSYIKRVIGGQEVVLSVQVAVALFVFGRLGNYFSSLALVYTLVVIAFTAPKLYEENKDSVDNAVNSVQKQTKTYYKQYAEPYVQKIPRASTSTANTGSITAGNHANTGDSADSFTSSRKPTFDSAVPQRSQY